MGPIDERLPRIEAALDSAEDLVRSLSSSTPPPLDEALKDAVRKLASVANHALAAIEGTQVWDQALQLSEERFEHAPVPLLVVDPMGFIERANEKILETVGATAPDVIGRHVGDYIHQDDYDAFADAWVRMQVDVEFDSTNIEFRMLTSNGPRWQRAALRASRDKDLKLTNLTSHFADIDEKYAAEAALDRSERGFGNLLDSLPDPIVRLNRTAEVHFANPAGMAFRDPDGEHEWPRVDDADLERYMEAVNECWTTGRSAALEHGMIVHGQVRWCESTLVPELGTNGAVKSLLVIWRDYTEQREHEALLAHRATHDPLTELPNRGLFADLLGRAIQRQAAAAEVGLIRPLSVLFLDLDRFKFVNDSLGHAAGDDLLRSVAARLNRAIRPGDVLGRLGGDEFTILAEDITADDALIMAERIQEHLRPPFDLNGREFIVSTSVGLVTAVQPEEAADLMRWADSAMYRAKAMGRGCVASFDDVLRPEAMEQLELDQLIRTSLNHDELRVHYQPEVDLRTGRIVGVEALLRWEHPTRGLLSAEDFIPVAEDNGMVIPMGLWVLRRSCEQVLSWSGRGLTGPDFVLRVNLSARQLEDPRLIDDISRILDQTGYDPKRLCLEITETALMRDVHQALGILTALDKLGIELAVDDFGTGYSSLSSLKRFPIKMLKIDRTFVDGIPGDPHDTAIVSTVLTLAGSLGLVVTAEGVEDEEQRQALIQMNCPTAQGYLFAAPQDGAGFEAMLLGEMTTNRSA